MLPSLRCLILGIPDPYALEKKKKGTDDFSEQDDVLASDEKHAAVGLGVRPRRRVEQPFDRLRQDQVGYTYYGAARGQPSVLFCSVL